MSTAVGGKEPSIRRHARRENRQRGRLQTVNTEAIKEQQVRHRTPYTADYAKLILLDKIKRRERTEKS